MRFTCMLHVRYMYVTCRYMSLHACYMYVLCKIDLNLNCFVIMFYLLRKECLLGHSIRSSLLTYFKCIQNKPIVLLKLNAFDGIESEIRKKFCALRIATIGCVCSERPSMTSILPRSKCFSQRRM